jgi:hypothetical protein
LDEQRNSSERKQGAREGGHGQREIKRLTVQDAGVRKELEAASEVSGDRYEKILGGCISKRKIPVLEMIEDATGIPVVGTSLERTSGPKSSQSKAWFQWQRGHRDAGATRWPDATIEFVGAKGVIIRVYALEISLQADIGRVGLSPICEMSMAKASQLGLTATLLANKPKYQSAQIEYWYFCPWKPTQRSIDGLLRPLQNMKGTENVKLTWMIVDHGGRSLGQG